MKLLPKRIRAAYAIHVVLVTLTAIGFFRHWGKTRFWLPMYVHYLVAMAFIVRNVVRDDHSVAALRTDADG